MYKDALLPSPVVENEISEKWAQSLAIRIGMRQSYTILSNC